MEWDSRFFGRRIGRVLLASLDDAALAEIEAWRVRESIDCLYFLADSQDTPSTGLAERHGFHLADVRVTLSRRLNGPYLTRENAPVVRGFRAEDLPALEAIAQTAHTDTRFYADPHFPETDCNHLYATWIRRSCLEEFADHVCVAEWDGRAAGYTTCGLTGNTGNIGLVGVAESARGQGLGGALVDAALRWFAEQGVRDVSVVTQGRNTAAIRLYERRGFTVQSMQLWYHWWRESV